MLVDILDEDDTYIDHRADRDGDVRLSRIDEKQAAVLLDDALALGVDAEFLRELTMRNRTWDQWREAVEEAIQGA